MAAVARGVVAREEYGVRGDRFPLAEVAVERLEKGRSAARQGAHRKVSVQHLGVVRAESGKVERGVAQLSGRNFDHPRFGDSTAGRRDERHAVAQRREPTHQRHDDALGAAVALNRKPVVRSDGDVHGRTSITSFVTCHTPRSRFCS